MCVQITPGEDAVRNVPGPAHQEVREPVPHGSLRHCRPQQSQPRQVPTGTRTSDLCKPSFLAVFRSRDIFGMDPASNFFLCNIFFNGLETTG
jgi:hypothetical protein